MVLEYANSVSCERRKAKIIYPIKERTSTQMKGTAILFHDDLTVTFLENIDLDTWKKTAKTENGKLPLENHLNQSNHEQLLLMEEDVDWDYGY